jgi:hypothetical protein
LIPPKVLSRDIKRVSAFRGLGNAIASVILALHDAGKFVGVDDEIEIGSPAVDLAAQVRGCRNLLQSRAPAVYPAALSEPGCQGRFALVGETLNFREARLLGGGVPLGNR